MEENTILQCEDSFVGILTGIYEAYALRISHKSIYLEVGNTDDLRLFSTYKNVAPDEEKAEKVSRTLFNRFGEEDYITLCMALAANSEKKAQAVYKTVVWGLSPARKGKVMGHLSDDNVRTVMELARRTVNELHHLKGFLRFHELEEGVLYAVIHPKNDILVPVAEHFSDRLPGENFLIYDEGRNRYAVHPAGKDWFIVQEEEENERVCAKEHIKYSERDEYYQELFWRFCHTISIEARKNLKLQQNMLPLRFRPYMVEFAERKRCT